MNSFNVTFTGFYAGQKDYNLSYIQFQINLVKSSINEKRKIMPLYCKEASYNGFNSTGISIPVIEEDIYNVVRVGNFGTTT